MVSYTSQSRVHLIRTYVSVLLAFVLIVVHVVTINSAQTDHAYRICSTEDEDVCTTTTSLSHLINWCQKNNISRLNLSELDIPSIVNMTLDFCNDSLPLVFLLSNGTGSEFVDFTTNCTISRLPLKNVSCGTLSSLQEKDKKLKHFYGTYVDILDRHEFSLDSTSQDEKQEKQKCEQAYKDWLCSSTYFTYQLNEKKLSGCKSTAQSVCLHCPSFQPENTYGGFMAFQCKDDAPDEEDDPGSCYPKCISSKKLKDFTSKATGG